MLIEFNFESNDFFIANLCSIARTATHHQYFTALKNDGYGYTITNKFDPRIAKSKKPGRPFKKPDDRKRPISLRLNPRVVDYLKTQNQSPFIEFLVAEHLANENLLEDIETRIETARAKQKAVRAMFNLEV